MAEYLLIERCIDGQWDRAGSQPIMRAFSGYEREDGTVGLRCYTVFESVWHKRL